MIGTASGLVAPHTDGAGRTARIVALLLLMVMVRLRMIAVMLLRLIMLVMWHNRWILVVGLSPMS